MNPCLCIPRVAAPSGSIQVAVRRQSTLAGSAPYYRSHLVLTPSRDISWPSKIEAASPLLSNLWDLAKDRNNPLFQAGFALSSRVHQHKASSESLSDSYTGVLHRAGCESVAVPFDVDASSIDRLASYIGTYKLEPVKPSSPITVYVCTHASRDCRCGTLGQAFFAELTKLSQRRTLSPQISVKQISHIGGHRFAANALVYPFGDWFGALTEQDALPFWSMINTMGSIDDSKTRDRQVIIKNWRGRLGMAADEQLAFFNSHPGSQLVTRSKRMASLGDPVELVFRDSDEVEHRGTAFVGETVKDVAKRLDLVEATCGGIQECASCHVYVRDGKDKAIHEAISVSDEEEQVSRVWYCKSNENVREQLEFAVLRKEASRLSCCLTVGEAHANWTKAGGYFEIPRG